MLTPEAPYPYPGSYALYVDTDLPPSQQHAELVRTMWRRVDSDGRGFVSVSFPLRKNASGNKVVPAAELIDATPLDSAEALEFHDLDRNLRGRSMRTPKQKREGARRDALKCRVIWSPLLTRLLREACAQADQRRAA